MYKPLSVLLALFIGIISAYGNSHAEYLKNISNFNHQIIEGQLEAAAESASKAALYCAKIQNYSNSFQLLTAVERQLGGKQIRPDSLPGAYYLLNKTRYEVYTNMKHTEKAGLQVANMLKYAKMSGNPEYNKEALSLAAQYYYLTGQDAKGNDCITSLIALSNSAKNNAATEAVFRSVIDLGVSANSASMVNSGYERYIAWKDSIETADADSELAKVNRTLAQANNTIKEKDSTISGKNGVIVTLVIILVAAVAVIGGCVLLYLRLMRRNRRLVQSVEAANEQSATKSRILHNLASTMAPTFKSLDHNDPDVKNLLHFIDRVGELSDVGDTAPRDAESIEDVSLQPFCEKIADNVRPLLKKDVKLSVDVPRVSAKIDASEVEKILEYLLRNAAKYTPEGGKIFLSYKKRGVHVHQFVVSDNGPGVAPERRDSIFTAFSGEGDLSHGTGLGLPICALRAEKLGGTLELDNDHSKGATFVLTLR